MAVHHIHIFILVTLFITLATGLLENEDESFEIDSLINPSHSWDRGCPVLFGRFPNPDDCSEFLECRGGHATRVRCHRGQLYDAGHGTCDDERRVACGGRRRDSSEEDDSSEENKGSREEDLKCTTYAGIYAHPKDCSKYVICKKYVGKVHTCRRGEMYDTFSRQCRDRRRVNCNGRLTPEELKTSKRPQTTRKPTNPPPTTPAEFRCPRHSGSFPHPVECSKYYLCKYGIHVLLQCRDSDLYDAQEQKCRHQRYVRCGSRLDRDQMKTSKRPLVTTTSTTKTQPTSTPIPSTTTSVPITTTPLPTTTPEPTTTTSEPTTTTPVPSTTTPEPATTTPEPTTTTPEPTTTTPEPPTTTPEPTTTTPEPTTTTPEPTTTTPEPTTTTPEPITTPEPTTTTPEPTTTTTSEQITTQTPTEEIVTDSTTKELVTKPNTPPPTDCKEDDIDCIIDGTGDVDGWFDCPEKYGHFPHGASRQLFIHCDNGRPFIKTCPEKTVFDPNAKVCVWM